jgi:hypothetical protein
MNFGKKRNKLIRELEVENVRQFNNDRVVKLVQWGSSNMDL